jgi:hypothetical protein
MFQTPDHEFTSRAGMLVRGHIGTIDTRQWMHWYLTKANRGIATDRVHADGLDHATVYSRRQLSDRILAGVLQFGGQEQAQALCHVLERLGGRGIQNKYTLDSIADNAAHFALRPGRRLGVLDAKQAYECYY